MIRERLEASKRKLGQKKYKRGPSRHVEMEAVARDAGVVVFQPKSGEHYTTYRERWLDFFETETCEILLPQCLREEHT